MHIVLFCRFLSMYIGLFCRARHMATKVVRNKLDVE